MGRPFSVIPRRCVVTYSLVGAPALGFDLARLPGGARVAAVLRTALTADPHVLAALATQHPGPVRSQWQATCEARSVRTVSRVLPDLAPGLDDPEAAG